MLAWLRSIFLRPSPAEETVLTVENVSDFAVFGEDREAEVYAKEREAYVDQLLRELDARKFAGEENAYLASAAALLMAELGVARAYFGVEAKAERGTKLLFAQERAPHSGKIALRTEFSQDPAANKICDAIARSLAMRGVVRVDIDDESPFLQLTACPLTMRDGTRGALCFAPNAEEFFFTEADEALLSRLSAEISLRLKKPR